MIVNPAYDFLKADYVNQNLTNVRRVMNESRASKWAPYKLLPWSFPLATLFTPVYAFAASDTFTRIRDMFLTGADYLFVFVTIFAGASWMLGNRSKGIELVIGAASGYLIIRHANDLLEILKTI